MFAAVRLKRIKQLPLLVLCLAAAVALGILLIRSELEKTSAAVRTDYTLVIDAGHGGIDSGAVGADGSKESDINLNVAQKLRALSEFFGLDNVMIRQDDISLSPGQSYSEHEDLVCRAKLVNAAVNPVLISIHQNCYPTGQPSGPQVLYSASESSEYFGKLTHGNLIEALDPSNRRVAEPASRKLYVLSHVGCPAILVECGFVSNFSDLGKLTDGGYQTKLSAVLLASYIQFTSALNQTET